ncbi:L-rhamnose mutarotase [Rubellimicrobium arenae]|uniref:L-rhamnose mutarotase n=1 Tax=Rubellimicrobium arenae TaxID=2817372 RepID=UPI001B3169ED|nr:L-rhamnose mutarotase [Rubellimicrobium arenae]
MTGDTVLRFGMVVGLRPDCLADYRRLHDGPGIRDLLAACNIRNFNIFVQVMPDGQLYEFAYYEYAGTDHEGDTARLAADPRNVEWHALCDPMQIPLPGHDSWTVMERIFFAP